MLKNFPPVVVQGLISLLCVSSSDPNPSIFLLTDPSSSNQSEKTIHRQNLYIQQYIVFTHELKFFLLLRELSP